MARRLKPLPNTSSAKWSTTKSMLRTTITATGNIASFAIRTANANCSKSCRRNGDRVYRVLEVNEVPLAGRQLEEEDRRVQRFLDHPQEIQKAQRKRIEDGDQAQKLLKMFPSAFQFRYDGPPGATTRLAFTPNPAFRPTDHPSEIFHHMEGTMLVDSRAKRVVQIDAHLTSKVKFGGGMLGHLDKGGTFCVKQSDVGSGHWDVTLLDIHMDGKALFFKTIAVRQKEAYSDYQPVPANVTPQQVTQLLTGRENTSSKGSPVKGN
jgi:hypothetical protein